MYESRFFVMKAVDAVPVAVKARKPAWVQLFPPAEAAFGEIPANLH